MSTVTKPGTVAAGRPVPKASRVKVWDLFVRCAHWLLVAGFFVAYFTEDDLLPVHVWAGYAVGVLVIARVVWGFIGPERARFRDFLYRPLTVLGYLFDLLRGAARRYLGHSPAGGAMVVLLLLGLAATVGSGLMVYAYDKHAGPLAGVVGQTVTRVPAGAAGAPESDENGRAGAFEAREDFWEEAHELLANLTLALVVLHVCGVLLASFVHKENLVAAMVTGKKRPAEPEPPAPAGPE